MKQKRQSTLLLILAVLFTIVSVFFIWRKVQPRKNAEQAQTIADWVHGSGGNLKVMVSYPAEMRQGEKNIITVTYQADHTLEAYLDMGYTFDAQFSAEQSVIMPQQRLLKPIQRGKNSFVWEIEPFMSQQLDASIQMAMGDSNLTGTYAISPQITFDLTVPIQENKGLSPDTSLKIGLVLLGLSGFMLIACFFSQKHYYAPKG
jgi:hypothetical protein